MGINFFLVLWKPDTDTQENSVHFLLQYESNLWSLSRPLLPKFSANISLLAQLQWLPLKGFQINSSKSCSYFSNTANLHSTSSKQYIESSSLELWREKSIPKACSRELHCRAASRKATFAWVQIFDRFLDLLILIF